MIQTDRLSRMSPFEKTQLSTEITLHPSRTNLRIKELQILPK